MLAVDYDVPGGPDVLKLTKINIPDISKDEVLIKVKSAGVNRPDIIQREGNYPAPPGHSKTLGLEVSGSPKAFSSMLEHMYHGANIALLGLLPDSTKINWDNIIFKGLNVKGIYGREMYETWYKMTQMLRSGLDITQVLTHKMPIDQFQDAFKIMESGNCGKVVLEW